MTDSSFLLFDLNIDKKGVATPATDTEPFTSGYKWIHLNAEHSETAKFLRGDNRVDMVAERNLLAQDSRPRTIAHEDDILINLRGVNLKTVRGIAESGIDVISVGALTHSAPNFDIGLDSA